jgi:hypothetical protein
MKLKHLALLCLLMLVTAVTGCVSCTADRGDSERKPTTRTAEPTDVIDKDLMVALSMAKNFHHKARVLMSDGKLVEAIASVREILSLQFPPNAPEADDVRNDARALLAKLLISRGQIEEAMTVVTEGLAQSQRESFFVANLYTAKGEVHEARADALDANDPANAARIKAEHHAAIEAYDKSNSINTALQKRLMEER